MHNHVILPNFIEPRSRYHNFWIFSKWRLPLSWIFKFLTVGHAKKVEPLHCAKFRLNRPTYGDFLIIQDGGRRHLWFLKFPIFNDRNGQEGRTVSSGQISSKSLELRLRYGDFSIFQDGGRPPSWIGFTRVGTIHEEYLVVFATVQNLVVIGPEFSTVCKF